MLIYNFQKEFIGIDEKDLKTLGFKNLGGLKAEVSDFADLFVKTPGYIHNFKHVHWIDFITCADSGEESKVIININNKNFRSTLTIQTAFLTDSPSAKAYIVYLNNLRELTNKESEQIAGDITERPVVKVTSASQTSSFTEKTEELPIQKIEPTPILQIDPYETPIEVNFDEEEEFEEVVPATSDYIPEDMLEDLPEAPVTLVNNKDEMLDVGDLSFDEEEIETQEEETLVTETVKESFDNGYVYDPHVASDELGLPLDLIEEFIQDFILQAKDFQENLYTSLNDGDLDNVKILSHKLKGVAANLRIEDAFEALATINTSSDITVIKENIDTFYKIIAKLAGEEIEVEKVIEVIKKKSENKDDKIEKQVEIQIEDSEDDLYSIDDTEVPQKIDLPELADDDFFSSALEIEEIGHELEDIEDIELLELDKELDSNEESLEDLDFEDETPSIEYSKQLAANEIGLDQKTFDELFDDYSIESQKIAQEMHRALSNNNLSILRSEAIKLKGMSENMRINNMTPELNSLINSSDTNEMSKTLTNIDAILAQISKIGS